MIGLCDISRAIGYTVHVHPVASQSNFQTMRIQHVGKAAQYRAALSIAASRLPCAMQSTDRALYPHQQKHPVYRIACMECGLRVAYSYTNGFLLYRSIRHMPFSLCMLQWRVYAGPFPTYNTVKNRLKPLFWLDRAAMLCVSRILTYTCFLVIQSAVAYAAYS